MGPTLQGLLSWNGLLSATNTYFSGVERSEQSSKCFASRSKSAYPAVQRRSQRQTKQNEQTDNKKGDTPGAALIAAPRRAKAFSHGLMGTGESATQRGTYVPPLAPLRCGRMRIRPCRRTPTAHACPTMSHPHNSVRVKTPLLGGPPTAPEAGLRVGTAWRVDYACPLAVGAALPAAVGAALPAEPPLVRPPRRDRHVRA